MAGYDPRNFDVARQIRERIARIPGVVDSHVHQVMDGPDLHYDIDRARAAEFGLTAQDVSNSMFVSLSSSSQVQPNFYLDPKMGTTYLVAAQTPQFRLDTVEKIGNTPIPVKNGRPGAAAQQPRGCEPLHSTRGRQSSRRAAGVRRLRQCAG